MNCRYREAPRHLACAQFFSQCHDRPWPGRCHSPIPTHSASFSVPYYKYNAYTGTMSLRGGVFFQIWFTEELHACKASISSISFASAACRARAANLTQDTWSNTTLQTFPHSNFLSASSYFCSSRQTSSGYHYGNQHNTSILSGTSLALSSPQTSRHKAGALYAVHSELLRHAAADKCPGKALKGGRVQ